MAKPPKCTRPGCKEFAAPGRLKLCVVHREEQRQKHIKAHNAKVSKQRQEWRKDNPVLCREEGCSNPVEKPRDHLCPQCREKILKATIRAKSQIMTESKPAPVEKWTPKPRPQPLMTDVEQRRIDTEVNGRLNLRCGYVKDTGRKLSQAEIDAIAREITPIGRIQHHSFGARELGWQSW